MIVAVSPVLVVGLLFIICSSPPRREWFVVSLALYRDGCAARTCL